MFLPPENRQPGPLPWEPPPGKPPMTRREETVVLWVIGFIVALLVLAPIGGGTLVEAVWYLVRHSL